MYFDCKRLSKRHSVLVGLVLPQDRDLICRVSVKLLSPGFNFICVFSDYMQGNYRFANEGKRGNGEKTAKAVSNHAN
jgi:hypothetical protein